MTKTRRSKISFISNPNIIQDVSIEILSNKFGEHQMGIRVSICIYPAKVQTLGYGCDAWKGKQTDRLYI